MSAGSRIGWRDRPRTVDPRGYVLVRFRDHHRADCRGYVYEHILVAEEMLGRPLAQGERVRRKDGDPSNNDPSNLTVKTPPDATEQTLCACGCGAAFYRFDAYQRERHYLPGHNPQEAKTRNAILECLASTPHLCWSLLALGSELGISPRAVATCTSKMQRSGLVERPRRGYFRLPGSAAVLPGAMRGPGRRPPRELAAKLPKWLRTERLEAFGGLCAYGCRRPAVEWDHLIPWVLGGTFRHRWNAVPVCVECNLEKRCDPPGAWIDRALTADYSSEPMESLCVLAIALGQASPEDFMTAEMLTDLYPDWTPDDWAISTIVPWPGKAVS